MKKQLTEINLIRPFIIFLLVVYHSFAIYCGAWNMPENIHKVTSYYWIGKFSYASMLECFVLISGYLFALSIEKSSICNVVKKKFNRLIIPSIIFSSIYILLFYDRADLGFRWFYDILNGVGHMWFLPMLFWCFILTILIEKIRIKPRYKLLGLLVLTFCSVIPIPFRISSTLYYLFFFYLGLILSYNREKMLLYVKNKKIYFFVNLFCFYVILFVIGTHVSTLISEYETSSIFIKAIKFSGQNLIKLSYSILGVLAIYMISLKITSRITHTPATIIKINRNCFGIYLIQQFILKYIYVYTEAPEIFGTRLLPWCALAITLILSYLVTYLLRKTPLRQII